MQQSNIEPETEQIDTMTGTRNNIRNKTAEGRKVLDEKVVDDKEREQQAMDAQEEMMDYLKQMIIFICTGDDKVDKENMELLADGIYDRAKQLHETYKKKLDLEKVDLRKTKAEEEKPKKKKKSKKDKNDKEEKKIEEETKEPSKIEAEEETKDTKRVTYAQRQSQFVRQSEKVRKTRKTNNMLEEQFEEDPAPKREDVIMFLEAIRAEFLEAVKKGDAEVDKVV